MTLKRLAGLLATAGIHTTRRAAPELSAIVEGVDLNVLVLPEARLIRIGTELPLHEGAERDDLLELVNQLNGELTLARCSTPWPTWLLCDYHLSYAGGLLPGHLNHVMATFARDCQRARTASQELRTEWGASGYEDSY